VSNRIEVSRQIDINYREHTSLHTASDFCQSAVPRSHKH
jgi:hypothetical protein